MERITPGQVDILYFITSDCDSLAFDTVEKKFREIADATRDKHDYSGWRVIACDINWEFAPLLCPYRERD